MFWCDEERDALQRVHGEVKRLLCCDNRDRRGGCNEEADKTDVRASKSSAARCLHWCREPMQLAIRV